MKDHFMGKYITNSVVQFNENHKWCGSLGIIEEVKKCGDDVRYMVGVPIPERGTAYIFSMESENGFDFIGMAALVPSPEEEEEQEND